MLPRTNFHTHSTFSDGKNTLEEMVQAALNRGMTALGFSDHGYAPHDPAAMSLEGEALYRAEVHRLREEYKGKIDIHLGYEHDASMPGGDFSQYDYVIESVHFLQKDGQYCPIDYKAEILRRAVEEWYGGDPYRMCEDYFQEVRRSILGGQGQIVGHIGLVTKFIERDPLFDMNDPRYLNPARETVKCAVDHGMLVEINTGAISRGYRTTPYPGDALLTYLRDIGGHAILSSDAHSVDAVDPLKYDLKLPEGLIIESCPVKA